jgi:hypothetical protein
MVVVGTWNLENLFRPGSEFGPSDEPAYEAKLAALAGVIDRLCARRPGRPGGRRPRGASRPRRQP